MYDVRILRSRSFTSLMLCDFKGFATGVAYQQGTLTPPHSGLAYALLLVSRFHDCAGTINLIRPSVTKTNLGHNFCTITGRALILGKRVVCDKTFPTVPCRDL